MIYPRYEGAQRDPGESMEVFGPPVLADLLLRLEPDEIPRSFDEVTPELLRRTRDGLEAWDSESSGPRGVVAPGAWRPTSEDGLS